jgi:hypothetical protein
VTAKALTAAGEAEIVATVLADTFQHLEALDRRSRRGLEVSESTITRALRGSTRRDRTASNGADPGDP